MDRATLVTFFLCTATAVAYADEIGLALKTLWKRLKTSPAPDLPPAALDLAIQELLSSAADRAERGAEILRAQNGTPAISRLVPLLTHTDPAISSRAARLLYERQDPAAVEALYWYHARRPNPA